MYDPEKDAHLVPRIADPVEDPITPPELLKNLLTPEDERWFAREYLQWLCHGDHDHLLEEDWERWLRQKKEVPAERCRHGKNPKHCQICYFEN